MGTWIEICYQALYGSIRQVVVPLVGTWIEITVFGLLFCPLLVVPLVGTWIEIKCDIITAMAWLVVPLVGTWIEISMYVNWKNPLTGRSP